MNLTRDDLKWTLGIVAAVIVGLATMGASITDYGIPAGWLPFIRLAALVIGIVSGKLATSPLPGRPHTDRVSDSVLDKMARSIPGVLLTVSVAGTLLLAIVAAGCASLGTTLQQAEKANHDTILLTEQMHASKQMTDAEFQKANVIINRVSVAGRELTKLARAGKATTKDVDTFLAVVAQADSDLRSAIPGGTIATLLDDLATLTKRAQAIKSKL